MRGFRVARVRGIELRAHWSLAIIVALVMSSIALGEVPLEHPGWSSGAAWIAGFAVAIGLVVSIALHELAHSLVAQRVGVNVPTVTLFAFGGIAQMGERPRRATHEFAITIAGPLTTLVIAVVLLAASSAATIHGTGDPASVAAFVALVLGRINLALAVFNFLPGAPLDGGRVLHSIIWRTTGDEARATRIATRSGQFIGIALASLGLVMLFGGVVPWFGTGAGGIWLLLIGWFIASMARAEGVSFDLELVAADAPVADITHAMPTARADMSVDRFAAELLHGRATHAVPVVDGRAVVGIASLRDALTVAEPMRADVPVRSVMTPWNAVHSIDAGSSIADALRAFADHDVTVLPVLEDGDIVGFVERDDVLAWLQLHAPSTPR